MGWSPMRTDKAPQRNPGVTYIIVGEQGAGDGVDLARVGARGGEDGGSSLPSVVRGHPRVHCIAVRRSEELPDALDGVDLAPGVTPATHTHPNPTATGMSVNNEPTRSVTPSSATMNWWRSFATTLSSPTPSPRSHIQYTHTHSKAPRVPCAHTMCCQ